MIDAMYNILAVPNKNIEGIMNKGILSTYVSIFLYIYNSFNDVIAIYSILIILDYISGILVSLKSKTFSRKKGLSGALKKIMSFSIIFLAMLLDYLMAVLPKGCGFPLYDANYIAVITSVFFIVTEGISFINNLKILGVKIPNFILNIFDILRKVVEKKEK